MGPKDSENQRMIPQSQAFHLKAFHYGSCALLLEGLHGQGKQDIEMTVVALLHINLLPDACTTAERVFDIPPWSRGNFQIIISDVWWIHPLWNYTQQWKFKLNQVLNLLGGLMAKFIHFFFFFVLSMFPFWVLFILLRLFQFVSPQILQDLQFHWLRV